MHYYAGSTAARRGTVNSRTLLRSPGSKGQKVAEKTSINDFEKVMLFNSELVSIEVIFFAEQKSILF